MTMPKAAFFGLALIALAVVWNTESVGQKTSDQLYHVSAATDNSAWLVNGRTGQVSYCRKEYINSAPKCGPWSQTR